MISNNRGKKMEVIDRWLSKMTNILGWQGWYRVAGVCVMVVKMKKIKVSNSIVILIRKMTIVVVIEIFNL